MHTTVGYHTSYVSIPGYHKKAADIRICIAYPAGYPYPAPIFVRVHACIIFITVSKHTLGYNDDIRRLMLSLKKSRTKCIISPSPVQHPPCDTRAGPATRAVRAWCDGGDARSRAIAFARVSAARSMRDRCVAMSRVRSLKGLYLLSFNPHRIKVNKKVQAFYKGLATTDAK